MKSILDRYLDRVLLHANKTDPEAESIRRELRDHLLQKIDDLASSGMPREEAMLEALRRHGSPRDIGYRLRGPFPWLDVRTRGTARGVIAVGPKAVGIFAFGGLALGVFAFGGVACGLFSMGGVALGLLLGCGGLAMGGIANGGFALGAIACGGFAVGILASGGFSAGLVAEGGFAIGRWVPRAGHAVSHYQAANVPDSLKALDPSIGMRFMETASFVIWPAFFAALALMLFLQAREMRRVKSDDDWLIDSQ